MTASLATRLRAPGLVALAGGGLAVALLLRDPHARGSWGYCPFLLVTGLPCPACGGLRAASDLLHGRVGEAASSNLYAVVTAALAAAAFTAWTAAVARGRRPRWLERLPRVMSLWFAGLVAFGALRLLPGMTELRP